MSQLAVALEIHHHWFDWIFFAIVGIPLILAVIELAAPDWLEPLIAGARAKVG